MFALLKVTIIIWLLNYVSPSMGAAEMLYSSHFIIKYEGRPPEGIFYQLPEILEEMYEGLSQELGYSLTDLIEVNVHVTTQSFTQSTGKPWWIAATSMASRIEIQPVEVLRKKGTLRTTLLHELTHVFINRISRNRCPLWLNEALALHFSGEGSRLLRKYGSEISRIAGMNEIASLPSVEVIEENLKNQKDRESSELTYWQAYLLFQCLLKQQKELKKFLYKLESFGKDNASSYPDDPFWKEALLNDCKE